MAARTLQETFFTDLQARLACHGYEPVVQYRASNNGTVEVVAAGELAEPVLSFEFHFQNGHNYLKSVTPIWPDGRSNPRMFIAHDVGEAGRALEQIIEFIARSVPVASFVLADGSRTSDGSLVDAEIALMRAIEACHEAAEGDCNDDEIEALHDALDLALGRWPGIENNR